MLSSLSTVPPVWPRPRPLILAMVTPQAAAMGPMIREVLSPTPPVECLSTFTPGRVERSTLSPEPAISRVMSPVSRRVMPRKKMAIIRAEAW